MKIEDMKKVEIIFYKSKGEGNVLLKIIILKFFVLLKE